MAPTHDRRSHSRRTLLRATGATLASGLAGVGAGCASLPPLGSEIRYGQVDIPTPDAPTYRDWLPAPSAYPAGSDGADGYNVTIVVPVPADAPPFVRRNPPGGVVVTESDYVGFHVEEADLAIRGESTVTLLGDVDRQAVRDTLDRTTYERDGSHAGYDLYARPNVDRVVGVGADAVVFGNGPTRREAVAATLDASRGAVPRYHEADENVAALTDAVGLRRWVMLGPGGIARSTAADMREDTVGVASTFDHDADGVYYLQTWLFPPTYDVTASRVKTALKGNSLGAMLPDADDATAVDVTVDGRVATIAVFFTPTAIEYEIPENTAPVPYVTWRPAYDAQADRLTLHHDAGDPVRTGWLTVDSPAFEIPAADATDAGDRIEPGDALTVSTADLGPDDYVRLVYSDPDAGDWANLFVFELP